MSNHLKENVSFGFIRYANCWEDADVLLEGLQAQKNSKIVSIGSAGDNSFSLLTTDPEMVVAVDVNPTQLYLIELKKVAIQHLSHQELIEFLGFRPSLKREEVFNRLRKELSRNVGDYWTHHIRQIKKGVISQGKFEHYFQFFSNKVLPFIHSHKRVEKLLHEKSAEEQRAFYTEHWNTWRWKLLFKIFFSKQIMGKYGRDPEFLKEVKLSVSDYILQQAGNHLQSVHAQNNFILRYNLTGNFGMLLPHYLQPENTKKIRENLDRLFLVEGYAEEATKKYGTFRYMNLSDIFEYMDTSVFSETSAKLIDSLESGGKMAYWNLMVPRRISAIFPQKVQYLKEESVELSKKDKGFFYKQFIIDQVK